MLRLTCDMLIINSNKLKDAFTRSGKLECQLNFTCHKGVHQAPAHGSLKKNSNKDSNPLELEL